MEQRANEHELTFKAMAFGRKIRPTYSEPTESPVVEAGNSRWTASSVLRHARKTAGESLPDVAAALRIRLVHLRAIEDGRFDDLPGPVYAIGFVRAYSEYLGLDGDRVVGMFRDEVAGDDQPVELNFPAPPPEGRVPGGAIMAIAVLLAVVSYGGWYYLSSTDRSLADIMPRLPERFAALLNDEDLPESATVGEAVADAQLAGETADSLRQDATFPNAPIEVAESTYDPAIANAAERPLSTIVLGGTVRADQSQASAADLDASTVAGPSALNDTDVVLPPTALATSQSADRAMSIPAYDHPPDPVADAVSAAVADLDGPPPPPPPATKATEGRVYGMSHSSRILIRAVQDSWVQVVDSGGSLVMTRLLRPGDTYQVPETVGLELDTGNAGGLEILVDGQLTPSLGGSGVVVRDISLNAEQLLSGTAVTN